MSKQRKHDLEFVRQVASPRWAEIISSIGYVNRELLDGQHHPCPKCGGTDRFRFFTDNTGGAICNKCFGEKNGDGFAVLQWLTGSSFAETLAQVCAYLGISPSEKKKDDTKPDEHLEFLPWDKLAVSYWCLRKKPITPNAVKSVGAEVAIYRGEYKVIAIPVWGEKLDKSKPVGWVIYNITGGTLPKWVKSGSELKQEWVKVKLTQGSEAGIIANLSRLANAEEVWKVEGPSDLLAFLSFSFVDLPAEVAAFTNANGAKERPATWMAKLCEGKVARVCHDADKPGQDGAIGWTDSIGRHRPGWCDAMAATATECRNVVLPYEIQETHGKDLRDFANDNHTFAELRTIAEAGEVVTKSEKTIEDQIIESVDDPHRLARINLEAYEKAAGCRATIRRWRDEWYTWTERRGCYRKIQEGELRAKIGLTVRKEFIRANKEEIDSGDKDEPVVRKVTRSLLFNVLEATASTQIVPSHVEAQSLISNERKPERKNWIALKNGILDIDSLLDGNDDCIYPHTPDWFSTVCLPYDFDAEADCPRWMAFLEKNLEGDEERIAILQEWAGYLLLPDTGQQRFLIMQGEGANGKSVYCAAMEALVGGDNASHVPLELFGDRFSKTSTLGKLVNISADAGEIEKTAEGFLKSFTAGETMNFDRKGIPPIDCYPTARLIIACNNLPRFSDRSDGIWRRMILIPWRVQIQPHERIPNMDKAWFWEQSGEMPGIFRWALAGLYRLRQQGRFSESQIEKLSKAEYQEETNPAKAFLNENLESSSTGRIECSELYQMYSLWCERNGNRRPLSDKIFGKEVRRKFPTVERKRGGGRSSRFWYYEGIVFSCEEICGKKTSEAVLF